MNVPEDAPRGDLHSEQGAERGDRPGWVKNPVIKVEGLAWLEFEKPDLDAAERFAHAFGFVTAARTADALYLRGARVGTHGVVIRKGPTSRFVAPAFEASDRADVQRLATANNASVCELRGPGGGVGVDLAGSVRYSAAGGRRRRGAAGVAAAAAAGVQLRWAVEPGQRDAAPAARAGADRAAGVRGAGDGVLSAGAGLVPGQLRPDRQRLPVLAGPA